MASYSVELNCERCSEIDYLNILPCLHVLCTTCVSSLKVEHFSLEPDAEQTWSCCVCNMPMVSDETLLSVQYNISNNSSQDNESILCSKRTDEINSLDCTEVKDATHSCCCSSVENKCHKREFVSCMGEQLQKKVESYERLVNLSDNFMKYFEMDLELVQQQLRDRADRLVRKILSRRDNLLLAVKKKAELIQYKVRSQSQVASAKLEELRHFSKLVSYSTNIANERTFQHVYENSLKRMSKLLEESIQELEMFNLKLQPSPLPDNDAMIDRLLGNLIVGRKSRQSNEVHTYHSGVVWPTSVSTSCDGGVAICGKDGAFQGGGKIMAYTNQAQQLFALETQAVPCDIKCLANQEYLVSLNDGVVLCLDSQGVEKLRHKEVFQGGGKIALQLKSVVITSSNDCCIVYLHHNLSSRRPVKLVADFCPNNISISPVEEIMAVSHKNTTEFLILTLAGEVLKKINSCNINGVNIRCLSSICFDNFGNLLVADFAVGAVTLLSVHSCHDSLDLGSLLSGTSGSLVDCPTAITVDLNNNLVVCEYGGDVKYYDYISCERDL